MCKVGKNVNPKALEARLQKYGSLDGIEAHWVCAACLGHAPKKRLGHLSQKAPNAP